jgi:hypothetical protein
MSLVWKTFPILPKYLDCTLSQTMVIVLLVLSPLQCISYQCHRYNPGICACISMCLQALFLFAQTNLLVHLELIPSLSLASCCCPGGKKSASSSKINETLGNPLIASRWCDGNASIYTPFSSITVFFESKTVSTLVPENSFFILSMRAIAKSILGPVTMHI